MADIQGLAGDVIGSVLNKSFMLVYLIIFAGVALAFFFVLKHITTFSTRVEIVEPRGDSVKRFNKRGGVYKNKESGVKDFAIVWSGWNPFSKKVSGAVPNKSDFWQDHKGRNILRVYLDGEDSYKIIPPIKPGEVIEKPVDIEWLNWGAISLKGKAERYRKSQTWLDKYGTYVGFGMVTVVMLFIVIFGFKEMGDISANMASISQAQADTAEALEGQIFAAQNVQTVKEGESLEGKTVIEKALEVT